MSEQEHLDPEVIEQATERLTAWAESQGIDLEAVVGNIAGSVIFGMVKAMVDAGYPVGKSLRLAGFLVIDGSAGRGALRSIGLSERSAREYRADIRGLLAEGLPEEVPAEYLADWSSSVQDRQLWAAKDQGGDVEQG